MGKLIHRLMLMFDSSKISHDIFQLFCKFLEFNWETSRYTALGGTTLELLFSPDDF